MQSSSKARMNLIFYKNPLAAIQDLTTSRIDLALMPLASVLGLAKDQHLNILAVTSTHRAPSAPDIPSVGEVGFGELAFFGGLGFFAPKEMPADLLNQVATDIRRVIALPEVKQRLEEIGYVARGDGPEAFRTLLQDQTAKWSTLLQRYNINPAQQQ